MRGFRLGSVFGFEIRIDYSWFIIFFLILWTFTFGVFPAESLEGVTAAGMMSRDPQTVPADMTLQDFVDDFILDGRHRAYPVIDEGRLVGLVTLDRVREAPREEWPRRAVRDVMRPRDELTVVSPREPMSRVLERIGGEDAGRIVVASGDRVEGVITRSDLARWIERAEMLEGS